MNYELYKISSTQDLKSISGYVEILQQTCISRSLIKSEFIALDQTGEESKSIQNLLKDMPYYPKPLPTICIHCNS
jgi:hypothetical protein